MADYKSQQINRGSISDILQLLQGFSSGHERARERIQTSQSNLSQLIQTAQTPEQIANAQQALRNIAGDSSRYTESSLGHQALSNVLQNKNIAYQNYNEGLENTVKYIEDAEFLDSEAEFMDLKSMANVMIEDENGELVGRYESVGALLREKYNSVNSLLAQIESGKQYGFRKDQIGSGATEGKTYSQQELTDKLTTQKGRLDTAMQAALINGQINEHEASMIMSGATPQVYENEKNKIITQNNTFISENRGRINQVDAINFKLAKSGLETLTDSDYGFLSQYQGEYQFGEETELLTLDAMILRGSEGQKQAAKILQDYKKEFNTDLSTRYETHEFWAGSPYAGDPELSMLKKKEEEEAYRKELEGEVIEKPAYFNSEKYGQLKNLEVEEKEKLEKQYGTSDPAKIKEIIQEKEETAMWEDIDKDIKIGELKAEAPKIISPSLLKRETPKEFVISKLEKDPSMQIPEDAPDVSFKDVMDSNIENKEAKAIEYYKLDGFKSSLGFALNKDGSRLSVEDLAYMNPTKLRSKLIKLKQDRKLKGAPTKEQNDLIKSILKDIAQIDKLHHHHEYPKKFKGKGKEPSEITDVKKRLMESYNKLMDDFMGNLNQKTISKIKDKYTK